MFVMPKSNSIVGSSTQKTANLPTWFSKNAIYHYKAIKVEEKQIVQRISITRPSASQNALNIICQTFDLK